MNTTNYKELFEKMHNPYIQGLVMCTAVLTFMILSKGMHLSGIMTLENTHPWTISLSFILFFALTNSVISLASDDTNKYWMQSFVAFIGLAIVSGLLAYLFSSMTISEVSTYQFIYIVFTFGYLVFISIIGFMKVIVEFAQREEWSKPRRKK